MPKKKKYYAYILPGWAKGKITEDWETCRREVSGVAGARYKSFEIWDGAQVWLREGAVYKTSAQPVVSRPVRKKTVIQPGIYFDAGTGAGDGVRIRVTDERGKDLLPESKRYLGRNVTNNYGELVAAKYGLEIAMKKRIKYIWGDSRLVIDYWSRGFVKKDVAPRTIFLAKEVASLRKKFEGAGGMVERIAGADNPADLGFHRG